MKTIRKRIFAALCAAAIIAATVTPAAAASTKVTGGGSRADATTVKINTTYVSSIKSSQDYSIFKFKTNTYKTYYDVRVINDTVSAPISAYFRGTDKKDAGNTYGNTGIKKGGWTYFVTGDTTLKRDSWYYIIIRNAKKGAGKITFRINAKKDLEGNAMSDAGTVKVGKNYYGKSDYIEDIDYFKFVPTATGKYRVVVKNLEVDGWLECKLMTANKSVLGSNDRVYEGKYMSVVKNLTKGTAYYIRVKSGCDEVDPRGAQYKVFIQKK